jgi:hypothetical protein
MWFHPISSNDERRFRQETGGKEEEKNRTRMILCELRDPKEEKEEKEYYSKHERQN